MKKLILALVMVISAGAAVAQTKIGHVNSQKILDTMPSRKAALKEMEAISKSAEAELLEMDSVLEARYQKFLKDQASGNMTPMQIQFEQEKLQRKQMEIQQREQDLQQQMQAMGNRLNKPVLERLQKAVDIVAERKKINYVIDETATLYFKGGTDLTPEVITEVLRLDAEATKAGK